MDGESSKREAEMLLPSLRLSFLFCKTGVSIEMLLGATNKHPTKAAPT